MNNSKFLDRCFAAAIVLAFLGLFTGIFLALIDQEPRHSPSSVQLRLMPGPH